MSRTRIVGAFLLAALPAVAQFENLAVTGDGGVIYFSTRLRPVGTSHQALPKIYRLDGTGFHLAAQASTPFGGTLERGGWMVESASVSGDGAVVAFNSRTVCRFGTPCIAMAQEFSEIRDASGVRRYLGTAEISWNGRYAALWRETGFGVFPRPDEERERGLTRLDLRTGMRTPAGRAPAKTGRWLGADGTILVSGWQLVTPAGGAISFGPHDPDVYRAVLSPDTSYIVYQAKEEPSILRIRDRAGVDSTLAETGSFPSISADSRSILYLAPAGGVMQAFLALRGGTARQVTNEPDGIREAVLSGTTALAVAVTGSGRLITVDTRNGFRSEYTGRSPKLADYPRNPFGEPVPVYPPQAPGSAYFIAGEHLAAEPAAIVPPLPFGAGGVRVFVNGTEAAIASVRPERIDYQVHWETRLSGEGELGEVVLRMPDSPFEAVLALRSVSRTAAEFLALGTETGPFQSGGGTRPLFGIHGDWRGLASMADPAVPGETIHFYATGLGPVAPPVPTGVAAPASPPARVPLTCMWVTGAGEQLPAEILFSGLAPGLVGYYQVSARTPALPPGPVQVASLQCDGGGTARVPARGE